MNEFQLGDDVLDSLRCEVQRLQFRRFCAILEKMRVAVQLQAQELAGTC